MASRRRSFLVYPLIVLACSLLGGLYAPGLEGAAASNSPDDDVNSSVREFTKVYALVEKNFAEPVEGDKAIYRGAIPGMLRVLDPHSNFFDPREFQALREEQRGHYYGVGMQISVSRAGTGKTIVLAPFPGAPAYRAGIRPGDTILAVDDKPTDNMSLSDIADLLKGPRGTEVKVTIGRAGHDTPLEFKLVRDEIPRDTVPPATWIRPNIAYIKIDQFNENTSRELEDNLRRLGENNIHGLILDLRGNPGGLLNEGVAVAGRFLRKGQVIVSHRGRASAEKPYTARVGNGKYDYPIVVLVNNYSASAAEIVSGALQDHDRAWILGENTFGKGLVQTLTPLSYGTGLALTTARYYTPSGRLIQRDYSNVSFYDYYFRKRTEAKNPLDAKSTDSGRTVYGGGGITPDEKYEPPKLDRLQKAIMRKYAFFNFVADYRGTHESKIQKGWEPDDVVMEDFRSYLIKNNVQFTEAEFAQVHSWIKQQIRLEMYSSALGSEEARKLAVETDPEVDQAVAAMPRARALVETAKKVVAERYAEASHK